MTDDRDDGRLAPSREYPQNDARTGGALTELARLKAKNDRLEALLAELQEIAVLGFQSVAELAQATKSSIKKAEDLETKLTRAEVENARLAADNAMLLEFKLAASRSIEPKRRKRIPDRMRDVLNDPEFRARWPGFAEMSPAQLAPKVEMWRADRPALYGHVPFPLDDPKHTSLRRAMGRR